ncbi:MAG: tetratricopeptide repeat protein [Spirochaetes bacterium]|nr:tetratricopeptide repeat protein [Spirochaetota bacterium]
MRFPLILNNRIKINSKKFLFIIFIIILSTIFSCYSLIKYEINDKEGKLLSPEKLLLKGQQAYDYGYYDIAIKYYLTIIEKYPEETYYCAYAYYEIGFIYYATKKYEEAKKYLNIVIEKYPDEKDVVFLANFLLSKIKDIENKSNKKS